MPRILTILLLCVFLPTAAAHADVVTWWNAVAVDTVAAERPGPPGLLDLAVIHTAMHDAVQAVEGRFEPYAYSDPSRRSLGTTHAAAAAAAYRTLVLLYPSRESTLGPTFTAYVAANGLEGDPALETGEAAAETLHSDHYRAVIPTAPFYGVAETGKWRSAVPMAFPYVAAVKPFTLNRASQFRPEPPPPLTSTRYAREYAEVKAIGAASAHPSVGTEIARFWSVDYVRQWNEALRDVASRHVATIGDSARLFALANLAASDALIAVWECKLHYNVWRPSTAIREGGSDGNAATVADELWTGLIADPPYPDYVSGANGLTGAFTRTLQLFFGTDALHFTVKSTSPLVSSQSRHYERISDAAQEVVDARVYLGIHFRFADEEGRRLGGRVAQWAHSQFLQPVAQWNGTCQPFQ